MLNIWKIGNGKKKQFWKNYVGRHEGSMTETGNENEWMCERMLVWKWNGLDLEKIIADKKMLKVRKCWKLKWVLE